ncbi:MAG: glycosyltransferase [Pedosphaera sp.]|nr:glycosyltransferase [Pedosphaera sp.]
MSYAPNRSELIFSNRTHSASQHSPSNNNSKPRVRRSETTDSKPDAKKISNNYPIIVHCHLCWDWVWQRPQQFLSRLSQRHPVLFVEMLAPDSQLKSPTVLLDTIEAFPNITRLRMQFPTERWHDGDYVDRTRRELLQEALSGQLAGKFDNAVQWFYDPMAVTSFAGKMDEIAIVYDCMDELSKFKHAHPDLVKREAELLAQADVVFTGGYKMWESKSRHNKNCHFYGCGVDIDHFGKARDQQTPLPKDLNRKDKPVLGYFGVVDERMDYELIAKLADANSNWDIAIVGPLAKVEESALPRRSNIHWLGGRPYAVLPAYCKAFDVCLMPFAMNEATEYINPTKALEYMATGKEVVSSAVPDVVRNFGTVVKVAKSHDEFISLCQQAVAKPDEGAIERGLKMVANNSWESIVTHMENHIEKALAGKQAVAATA